MEKKDIYDFILEHELNNTIQFLKDELINSPIQNNINNLQYNDKKEKIISLIEDEFIPNFIKNTNYLKKKNNNESTKSKNRESAKRY